MERECANARRLGATEPSVDSDDEAEASGAHAKAEAEATRNCPTAAMMAEWRELYEIAEAAPARLRIELRRVPTGATRAAFEHGASEGPCVAWRLDHLLYTPRGLTLASYARALEACPELVAAGTPNAHCPSDHLPVVASFAPCAPEALGEAARAELLRRVTSLIDEQARERAVLAAKLAEEVSALEAAERHAAVAEAEAGAAAVANVGANDKAAGKKKKGAKPKAGPPSAEMQALLRSRRERERALRAAQQAHREELRRTLDDVELDAIEEAAIDLS